MKPVVRLLRLSVQALGGTMHIDELARIALVVIASKLQRQNLERDTKGTSVIVPDSDFAFALYGLGTSRGEVVRRLIELELVRVQNRRFTLLYPYSDSKPAFPTVEDALTNWLVSVHVNAPEASYSSELPTIRSEHYEYLNRREEFLKASASIATKGPIPSGRVRFDGVIGSAWKKKSQWYFEVWTYTGRIIRMAGPGSQPLWRTGFHVRVLSFARETGMGYLMASDAVVEVVATTRAQLEAKLIRLEQSTKAVRQQAAAQTASKGN